jgi:hypothetical protein
MALGELVTGMLAGTHESRNSSHDRSSALAVHMHRNQIQNRSYHMRKRSVQAASTEPEWLRVEELAEVSVSLTQQTTSSSTWWRRTTMDP